MCVVSIGSSIGSRYLHIVTIFNSSLPSWVPFVSHLIAEWHTFIYCGFVASFEMRMCGSSKFVLFQVLGVLGPLNFHMNFKISSLYLKRSQLGFL